MSVWLDVATTIAAGVVVGGIIIARGRAARRGLYVEALERLTNLLEAGPAELAMLLGTSRETLARWYANGAPQAAHGDIIRLLRTAVALRGRLTPSTSRQLLLLRQRRTSDTARDYEALLPRHGSHARPAQGVIITVR